MKYMVMLFGDQQGMFETRTPEWIRSMIAFMGDIEREFQDAGELVASEGLVDPSLAKTIRFEQGAPVVTDGPLAEAKEALAGYYLVDTSEDRVLEVATRISAFIEGPVEVRQVADAPPEV